MKEITCFKADDVRGRRPDQLNEEIARRIGRAFAEVVKPQNSYPDCLEFPSRMKVEVSVRVGLVL